MQIVLFFKPKIVTSCVKETLLQLAAEPNVELLLDTHIKKKHACLAIEEKVNFSLSGIITVPITTRSSLCF